MRVLIGCVIAALVGSSLASNLSGANSSAPLEPANSIKDVMKKAHKDGVLKKVLDGQGTKEDKELLLDLYIDMIENKPEKGEQSDWIMASGRVVLAAGKVVVGREGSLEELKEATNCKACHDVFK